MLISIYQKIRKWIYRFSSSCSNLKIHGKIVQPTIFSGKGKIYISKNSSLGTESSPGFLNSSYIEAREKSAQITVGSNTHLNNCSAIIAEKTSITISDNVLIGFEFCAMDSDFHSVNPGIRNHGIHVCKPIFIAENVFIGSKVTILKGVTIGKGAVIAAGSIVTKNIPEYEVWGGIPAKKLYTIKHS